MISKQLTVSWLLRPPLLPPTSLVDPAKAAGEEPFNTANTTFPVLFTSELLLPAVFPLHTNRLVPWLGWAHRSGGCLFEIQHKQVVYAITSTLFSFSAHETTEPSET